MKTVHVAPTGSRLRNLNASEHQPSEVVAERMKLTLRKHPMQEALPELPSLKRPANQVGMNSLHGFLFLWSGRP